ncbi:MAG TPA: CDP-alcohol phosphatidyltransferase family protein [Thermoanaerobaculia bacterium]|nr:CDP-alcohol phosphatidyltransferase family protein [Thermoanaerobaculia bacterium]
MRHLPNILTFARLLLVPCFLVASMRHMYTTAFVLFVTAAVTDILDGLIARRLNVRSRLGALLDPAADKTLMVCGFLYYTFARDLPVLGIPGWLTFAVMIRDVLIVFTAYLMYTRVQITRFPPSAFGKASTVLQAITVATIVAVNAFLPRLAGPVEVLFKVTLLITLYSGWDYMRRASLLLKEDVTARA